MCLIVADLEHCEGETRRGRSGCWAYADSDGAAAAGSVVEFPAGLGDNLLHAFIDRRHRGGGAFNGRAQPTIPTYDGLVLRPWMPADAPAVFEALRDPEIRRWHVRVASSRDEVDTWVNSWVTDWPAGRNAHWAVADPGTNELIGRASLKHIDLECGQGEVAYWTMPGHRRQGVATQAVEALTMWAFDVIGFHRLELTHSVHNRASCGVAIHAGFHLEGTKRSAGLHVDGWHDMHLHARVNDR
jgi:[ribosomal protein S5]-alanine N-acetyltransferase